MRTHRALEDGISWTDVYVQYCTAQRDSKLIASEKAGLYGWHKDRGSICQGQY